MKNVYPVVTDLASAKLFLEKRLNDLMQKRFDPPARQGDARLAAWRYLAFHSLGNREKNVKLLLSNSDKKTLNINLRCCLCLEPEDMLAFRKHAKRELKILGFGTALDKPISDINRLPPEIIQGVRDGDSKATEIWMNKHRPSFMEQAKNYLQGQDAALTPEIVVSTALHTMQQYFQKNNGTRVHPQTLLSRIITEICDKERRFQSRLQKGNRIDLNFSERLRANAAESEVIDRGLFYQLVEDAKNQGKFDDKEKIIIKILTENPQFSEKDIGEIIGLKRNRISQILSGHNDYPGISGKLLNVAQRNPDKYGELFTYLQYHHNHGYHHPKNR